MEYSFKAVLFDFDGVVVDTESQYTIFWDEINEKYLTEVENLALKLKGNTLVEVFEKYFPNNETRAKIKKELNEFQSTMTYPYIPGVAEFVKKLRNAGVKTAVATSSDRDKMSFVYKACPEIRNMFDSILTAEDYKESKPSPDCYITAAKHFGFSSKECIVVEDSVNGLMSAAASGSMVIGLTTSNPEEVVKKYSDVVIPNFSSFGPEDANKVFCSTFCNK